jgi:xanthosine utilization system XapX-like protein
MSACVLPPMLAKAGCQLIKQGRKLIVLDGDGAELEQGTRGRWEWLCAASAAMLIERVADALGLQHELHLKQLKMRLWRPGDDPEAAPWRPFEAALAWLAEVEAARAAAEAQRLAAEARRWLGRFVSLLGGLLQGMSQLRARVRRQRAQSVGRVGVLGQVVGGPLVAWAWTVGGGLPVAWAWTPGRGPPIWAGAEA